MNTIPFNININDQVKVRVTAVGHRALKSDHFELFRERGHTRAMELYTPPREDTDGWSTWTMWDLMRRLGPHMRMGNPSPIETTIQFFVGEE
jgi:hypothetical protein